MIALLAAGLGVALAQDSIEGCLNDDTYPIGGTAGYRTGLEAMRVNAATYNATAFAERSLFPETRGEDEGKGKGAKTGGLQGGDAVVVYEVRQTFGVTRVPTWSVGGDCPDDLRFQSRPVDLMSANLGVAGRWGPIGAYYAAGIVYGNVSEPTNRQRIPMGILLPLGASYGLVFSGLAGSRSVVFGSTALAVDSIAGLEVHTAPVDLRAGWAFSRGLHLSATEKTVGFFGNAVLRQGLSDLSQFAAGAGRVRWGEASKVIGRTSAFARGLPIAEVVDLTTGQTTTADLLTGHLQQEDIGRWLDLAAAVAFAPERQLNEARVGVHSPGFHDAGERAGLRGRGALWRVQGGMTQIPTQWAYDVPGGTYLHLRGDVAAPFALGDDAGGVFRFGLMMNDPEQLALFPFAVNAVSYSLDVKADF